MFARARVCVCVCPRIICNILGRQGVFGRLGWREGGGGREMGGGAGGRNTVYVESYN